MHFVTGPVRHGIGPWRGTLPPPAAQVHGFRSGCPGCWGHRGATTDAALGTMPVWMRPLRRPRWSTPRRRPQRLRHRGWSVTLIGPDSDGPRRGIDRQVPPVLKVLKVLKAVPIVGSPEIPKARRSAAPPTGCWQWQPCWCCWHRLRFASGPTQTCGWTRPSPSTSPIFPSMRSLRSSAGTDPRRSTTTCFTSGSSSSGPRMWRCGRLRGCSA